MRYLVRSLFRYSERDGTFYEVINDRVFEDFPVFHHLPGGLKAEFAIGLELHFVKKLVAGGLVRKLGVGFFVAVEVGTQFFKEGRLDVQQAALSIIRIGNRAHEITMLGIFDIVVLLIVASGFDAWHETLQVITIAVDECAKVCADFFLGIGKVTELEIGVGTGIADND